MLPGHAVLPLILAFRQMDPRYEATLVKIKSSRPAAVYINAGCPEEGQSLHLDPKCPQPTDRMHIYGNMEKPSGMALVLTQEHCFPGTQRLKALYVCVWGWGWGAAVRRTVVEISMG